MGVSLLIYNLSLHYTMIFGRDVKTEKEKWKKGFTRALKICILIKVFTKAHDSVAQLVERYVDIVEVVGSSPIGITILNVVPRRKLRGFFISLIF